MADGGDLSASVRSDDGESWQELGALAAEYAAGTETWTGVPVVSMHGMTKRFAAVTALSSVDLDIHRGTVHAVVGENGAGKSTLSRIMAGLIQPDGGDFLVDGSPAKFHGPDAAQHAGISFVPQELSIAPRMSIAENIFMGRLPTRAGMFDRRALRRRTLAVLRMLSLDVDPLAPLGGYGPGVQQLVVIARGLSRDARLFILDEPTASLTDREVTLLFDVLRRAKNAGAAFVYISHRLQELEQIADEVTVIRDGRSIFSKAITAVTRDEVIRAMVGRPIERLFPVTTERPAVGGTSRDDDAGAVVPTLSVRGLTRAGSFSDVSFSVPAGSIVGVAGLLGAGRTEVLRCIFGVDPADSGEIHLRGRRVRIRSPRHAIRQGINLVPEERKGQGLVLGMSIGDNLTAPHLSRFSRYGWLLGGPARTAAATIKHRLGVKAAKLTEPVGNLSGGNQQKVVIGKAVLGDGDVYLLDEPTRGVDVGAKVEIYAIIAELAQRGSAVVVVSSELPELLGICDRILVMREGRIVADLPTADSSEEIVLAAAMGHEEAGFRDELA